MNNLDKLSYLSDDIAGIFQSIDEDHSGEVTFEEMLKAFLPGCAPDELAAMCIFACKPRLGNTDDGPGLTNVEIEDFKAMFKLYDTDNSGTLSVAELFEALNHTPFESSKDDDDQLVSVQYLKELCETYNGDSNEELTVEQFIELMTTTIHKLLQ
jgi:Ca2+-binding EF-hand superfamily protein